MQATMPERRDAVVRRRQEQRDTPEQLAADPCGARFAGSVAR